MPKVFLISRGGRVPCPSLQDLPELAVTSGGRAITTANQDEYVDVCSEHEEGEDMHAHARGLDLSRGGHSLGMATSGQSVTWSSSEDEGRSPSNSVEGTLPAGL